MQNPFKVVAPFEPAGDQPKAIAELADGLNGGLKFQTLLVLPVPERLTPWPKSLRKRKDPP